VIPKRTIFVALEGIDASGKGVQSRRLAERLGAKRFKFPDYTTPIGALIKAHLERHWSAQWVEHWLLAPARPGGDALVFQGLQAANRLELAPEIMSELIAHRSVVADRYYGSGLVYGSADGIELEYLERLHRFLPEPTHQILIDIDPETSAARRPERRDRYEADTEFLTRVSWLYRMIWTDKGWPMVDGDGTVEQVEARIWRVLKLGGA
jgi:dTMP kinase